MTSKRRSQDPPTPTPLSIPLARAVICIDCDSLMAGGRKCCVACGSSALATVEPWLMAITRVKTKTEAAWGNWAQKK